MGEDLELTIMVSCRTAKVVLKHLQLMPKKARFPKRQLAKLLAKQLAKQLQVQLPPRLRRQLSSSDRRSWSC